jgi:hypothetical protein
MAGPGATHRAAAPSCTPATRDRTGRLPFRLWRRPEVRVGGRYPVGPVHIEIDSMELMPFSAIAEADVRRCGEKDRESLRERAAHASPIAGDTLLWVRLF